MRLPAEEIEALVSSQLKELLESPQRLLDLLSESSASPGDVQRLLEAIQQSGDSSDKAQSLLKSAVARIVVYDEQIEVQIDLASASSMSFWGKKLALRSDPARKMLPIYSS